MLNFAILKLTTSLIINLTVTVPNNITTTYRFPEEGDYRTLWDFKCDDDIKKKWITSSDGDWGEGYTTCALDLRENGRTAMFHGELNTRPPNDGRKVQIGG